MYWWSIWQFRENIDWNFPRFLIQTLPAVILYLQATVLVTSTPQAVPSWREHYYSSKLSISVSRSQISLKATDCTRPAERLPGSLRHNTGDNVNPTR